MRVIKKKNDKVILTTNLPDGKETEKVMITTSDFEQIGKKLVLKKEAKKRLGIKEESKNADK